MASSMSRFLTYQVVSNVMPVVAVVLFAITDVPWLGYGWSLATLTLFALYSYATGSGTGAARTARLLLVAAVMLGTGLFQIHELNVPLVLSGAALLWLISFEPLMFRALRLGQLDTANLEVERPKKGRWLQPHVVSHTNFGLIVCYVLVAAFDVLAWPLVAAVAAVAAVDFGALFSAWLRRRQEAYQTDMAVLEAVERHAPKFALNFSGPTSAQYQLLMWLPYFDMLGDPYVVILREERNMDAFVGTTKAPIVVAPSIAAMESMLVPSIRAVFYANNSMKNTHCVRFGELTHIQLMHGDSEKPASRNPVSAMYDRVFVAGQAGIDRYRRYGVKISDEQFRVVGRPQVAEIAPARRSIRDIESPTVLYAPTWTGDSADVNFSSLPLGESLVSQLLERGATVWLREHPFTRRNIAAARQLDRVQEMLAEDRDRTGRQHKFGAQTSGEVTFADCCNAADAMVGDVSGVISDWLYSGKPFAATDMLDEGGEFAESFPLSRVSYVINADGENIPRVLDDLLRHDPAEEARQVMRSYYLGDFPPERYVGAFLDAARECYQPGAEPTVPAQPTGNDVPVAVRRS